MRLNTIKPKQGSIKAAKRVGRGIGCGSGKTCGRGFKGQKSRSGGYHKVGFEGGQMPIQRRLPKVGFSSKIGRVTDQVRLGELAHIDEEIIDIKVLKSAGIVGKRIKRVKVIKQGKLDKPVHLKGMSISRGADASIKASKGKVSE